MTLEVVVVVSAFVFVTCVEVDLVLGGFVVVSYVDFVFGGSVVVVWRVDVVLV